LLFSLLGNYIKFKLNDCIFSQLVTASQVRHHLQIHNRDGASVALEIGARYLARRLAKGGFGAPSTAQPALRELAQVFGLERDHPLYVVGQQAELRLAS